MALVSLSTPLLMPSTFSQPLYGEYFEVYLLSHPLFPMLIGHIAIAILFYIHYFTTAISNITYNYTLYFTILYYNTDYLPGCKYLRYCQTQWVKYYVIYNFEIDFHELP